jgi:tetratricopeptide (TPR) repeat protein
MKGRRAIPATGALLFALCLGLAGEALGQKADAVTEADQLRNAGRYGEAIATYEQILGEFPENGPALYGLGICYTYLSFKEKGTESLEKARTYLEKLVSFVPKYGEYRHFNGYAALQLALRKSEEPEEKKRLLELAEKEVTQALDLEEKEASKDRSKGTLGQVYNQLKKFAEAKALFQELSGKNAGYMWYWFWLGQSEEGLGNEAGAVEANLKALALKPDFPNAMSPLTAVSTRLRKEGKYAEDAELLKRIIACKPIPFHLSWSWKFLGEDRIDLGDMEGAIEAMKEAEEADPEEAAFPNRLGLVYLAVGKVEPALEAFGRAIRKNPNILYPYENLGTELGAQGRLDEAFTVFRDGWLTASNLAKTAKQPDFRAEAEYYRFLFRRAMDTLEAYRK